MKRRTRYGYNMKDVNGRSRNRRHWISKLIRVTEKRAWKTELENEELSGET